MKVWEFRVDWVDPGGIPLILLAEIGSTLIHSDPPEILLENSRSIVGHVLGSMPRRPGHRCPLCERQIRWQLAYCADCAGPTASTPVARRRENITWLEYRQRQRATRLRAA